MTDMLATLIAAIPTSALPLVVTVLGLFYIYRKIDNQRKDTKCERDADSQALHDEILKHSFKLTELQGIVDLHRDKLDSIDKQLGLVNQELVRLNVTVEHLAKSLERQNEIMMDQLKKKEQK